MEIPPSSSLIAALSEFTESRSTTAATEARRQEKTRVEAQEAQRADDSAATDQRLQVSSERELEAARDAAARQADEQAILRREAPTAGVEERHQPPGQIIDISV